MFLNILFLYDDLDFLVHDFQYKSKFHLIDREISVLNNQFDLA